MLKKYCEIQNFMLTTKQLELQCPDQKLIVHDHQNNIQGRCSLWWQNTPEYEDKKVGLIGHFIANNEESAKALLNFASAQFMKKKCDLIIGPMDGSTWGSYRFLTDKGMEPTFFLEPNNPLIFPKYFEDNNFVPLANYYSSLCTELDITDVRLQKKSTKKYFEKILSKINIRLFNQEEFEKELEKIYYFSLKSFKNNFLYTSISIDVFMENYLKLKPIIIPELIQIAEYKGTIVGLLFAVPDLLQQHTQGKTNTLIIKTLATLPKREWQGLGVLLLANMHKKAKKLGFKRIIHALMYEKNTSMKLSQVYTQKIRTYTLYKKEL